MVDQIVIPLPLDEDSLDPLIEELQKPENEKAKWSLFGKISSFSTYGYEPSEFKMAKAIDTLAPQLKNLDPDTVFSTFFITQTIKSVIRDFIRTQK